MPLSWSSTKSPTGRGRSYLVILDSLTIRITPKSGRYVLVTDTETAVITQHTGTLTECFAAAEKIAEQEAAEAAAVPLATCTCTDDYQTDATPKNAPGIDATPQTIQGPPDPPIVDPSPILGDPLPTPRGWDSVETPEMPPEPLPSVQQFTKKRGRRSAIDVTLLYRRNMLRGLYRPGRN